MNFNEPVINHEKLGYVSLPVKNADKLPSDEKVFRGIIDSLRRYAHSSRLGFFRN